MADFALLLTGFFELSFSAILLLLLHSLRKHISLAPFYLALGSILIFSHLIAGSGQDISFMTTPFIMALLIIYALDGTLHAQRLTIGAAGTSAIFFYLSYISNIQYQFVDQSSLIYRYFNNLFSENQSAAVASMATMLVQLLTLPTLYQLYRNRAFGVFTAITAAFLSAQVIDSCVYTAITTPWDGDLFIKTRDLYLSRCLPMIWLAGLTAVYLKLNDHDFNTQNKSPLDYIGALFKSYTPEQLMRKHISEWDERFELFFNNSQNVIFLAETNGRIVEANQMCTRVTGLENHQIKDRFVDELLFPQIEQIPKSMSETHMKALSWKKLMREASKSEEKRAETTWIIYDKESQPVIYDFLFKKINTGKIELILFSGRDITEQTRLAQEKEQLSLQLQHSQRLEAVGQLAGGVAHDFNNLLHSIQGNLDNLKIHIDPERKGALTNIDAAVNRASTLTGQLLGFARKGKYQVSRFDIAEIMQTVHQLFEPTARKTLRIQMLIHPDAMMINGDKTQLEQALLNLLINAKDALEGRERAKIIFRAEPVKEKTPGWQDAPEGALIEDYICIRCKDNGTGIPDSVRDKIFDPFFTTKSIGKGTGMGLAMVYGTIQNHEGWIHLESIEDKGTEFFIFLPRHKD